MQDLENEDYLRIDGTVRMHLMQAGCFVRFVTRTAYVHVNTVVM